MIYNILIEQKGEFVKTGETVECTFDESQDLLETLQAEHGCCVALEAVIEQLLTSRAH